MASPLRILVVEDDLLLLGCLGALITGWGFTCDIAKSATEAIRCAERNYPDVVVSDLIMPGMDGVDLLKSLKDIIARRQSSEQRQSPMFFILMTGHSSVSEGVRAIMAGADEVLFKPIKETALLLLLQRVDARRESLA